MTGLLELLEGLPPALVYIVLGLGAAIENILPPVPADTFVLFGGFVAARGLARVEWVFVATWLGNVASALFVYLMGYRYGRRFFELGAGARILNADQLSRVEDFYARRGIPALFFTRFLPGLRAVVPVFAGVSRLRMRVVAPPVLVASALWYGVLTYLGASAGENLEQIQERVGKANLGFLLVALALIGVLLIWWRRTRQAVGDADRGGPST